MLAEIETLVNQLSLADKMALATYLNDKIIAETPETQRGPLRQIANILSAATGGQGAAGSQGAQ